MLFRSQISSDVWLHSADVREQAQRRKACSAGGGAPATAPAAPAPDVHRADVSDADSGSSSDWSHVGSHATGVAAVASTSTASADAVDAKIQACRVHERSSPCVFPLCRPHGHRRLATHSRAGVAYRSVQ